MLRSTCTTLDGSSARAGGRTERGHPTKNPPSISTMVSSAVVRSLVIRNMAGSPWCNGCRAPRVPAWWWESFGSLDDDQRVHLVGMQPAGHGVRPGRDRGRLLVQAG